MNTTYIIFTVSLDFHTYNSKLKIHPKHYSCFIFTEYSINYHKQYCVTNYVDFKITDFVRRKIAFKHLFLSCYYHILL